MPAYVFRCRECGVEADVVCPIADKPDELACGECGGPARSVPAWAGSTRLRGAGWASKPERDTAFLQRGPQSYEQKRESARAAGVPF